MSLKDVMRDDLRKGRVWFDPDAMGSYHNVNGASLLCIVNGAAMANSINSPQASEKRRSEGVQTGTLTLFVRTDEYRSVPYIGQSLTLDGRKYQIVAAGDSEGVLEIHLSEVRARC